MHMDVLRIQYAQIGSEVVAAGFESTIFCLV